MSVKELRLTMRLSNNRIKEMLQVKGLTVAAAAKKAGVHLSTWHMLTSLRQPPLRRLRDEDGRWSDRFGWSKPALKISKALGVTPEYLWPEGVLKVTSPTIVREIDAVDLTPQLTAEQAVGLLVGGYSDDTDDGTDRANAVRDALEHLTPREARMMMDRFGFEGREFTTAEVAESFEISRSRAAQIMDRAQRKLQDAMRKQTDPPPNRTILISHMRSYGRMETCEVARLLNISEGKARSLLRYLETQGAVVGNNESWWLPARQIQQVSR